MNDNQPLYRYRTNWRGKLILQIGEFLPFSSDFIGPDGGVRYALVWRDAKLGDIPLQGGPVK